MQNNLSWKNIYKVAADDPTIDEESAHYVFVETENQKVDWTMVLIRSIQFVALCIVIWALFS